jgi:hypothetical protein
MIEQCRYVVHLSAKHVPACADQLAGQASTRIARLAFKSAHRRYKLFNF